MIKSGRIVAKLLKMPFRSWGKKLKELLMYKVVLKNRWKLRNIVPEGFYTPINYSNVGRSVETSSNHLKSILFHKSFWPFTIGVLFFWRSQQFSKQNTLSLFCFPSILLSRNFFASTKNKTRILTSSKGLYRIWKTTGSKDLMKCSTSSSVNFFSSGVLLCHLSLYRSKCSLKNIKNKFMTESSRPLGPKANSGVLNSYY